MSSDTLQSAIASIRSGDKETGKLLLAEVIRDDPRNETAWLWMSGAVDSVEERLYCLDRVLQINSNNDAARRGRTHLQQQKLIPEAYEEPWQSEDEQRQERPPITPLPSIRYEQHSQQITDSDSADNRTRLRIPSMTVAIVVGIVLALVFCIGSLAFVSLTGALRQSPITLVTPTTAPSSAAMPSPTWPPTWTPQALSTPTPNLCSFDNPETKKYLVTSAKAIDEVTRALECAMRNGTTGPEIAPCTDQLRKMRNDFRTLWYPSCAINQRYATLAFLDEAIDTLEAAEQREEATILLHDERFRELADAAEREFQKLGQILKEADEK